MQEILDTFGFMYCANWPQEIKDQYRNLYRAYFKANNLRRRVAWSGLTVFDDNTPQFDTAMDAFEAALCEYAKLELDFIKVSNEWAAKHPELAPLPWIDRGYGR